MVTAFFIGGKVITESSNEARELYNLSRYGALLADGRVALSLLEAHYLLEKDKIRIVDSRNKDVLLAVFSRKCLRLEPRFSLKYPVFSDIRSRGYIIKTALKFGADFRVYDRGLKPGEAHAKWVIFPVHEGETFTWHEFAAKNRVAHATKKNLLIAVVDDELDVSYWEVSWTRP